MKHGPLGVEGAALVRAVCLESVKVIAASTDDGDECLLPAEVHDGRLVFGKVLEGNGARVIDLDFLCLEATAIRATAGEGKRGSTGQTERAEITSLHARWQLTGGLGGKISTDDARFHGSLSMKKQGPTPAGQASDPNFIPRTLAFVLLTRRLRVLPRRVRVGHGRGDEGAVGA